MLISFPIELRERIDTEDLLNIGNGVAVLASQCRRKFLARETNSLAWWEVGNLPSISIVGVMYFEVVEIGFDSVYVDVGA